MDCGEELVCTIKGKFITYGGVRHRAESESTCPSSCLSPSSPVLDSDNLFDNISCEEGVSRRGRVAITIEDQEDGQSIYSKVVSAIGKWSPILEPAGRRRASVSHTDAISAASSSGFM